MTVNQLPSFSRPPVIEVVAGVQFEPIAELNTARLGLLWSKFRGRFPLTEQKPPLDQTVERVGARGTSPSSRLEILDTLNTRLWFLNRTGDELVQVQNDRLIRNWRRLPGSANTYPRFDAHVLPGFKNDFATLLSFLESESVARPRANQCEVTYINHIHPNERWTSHADISKVFRGWAAEYASAVGKPVEGANCVVTHQLVDDGGEFVGRLHIALQSAFVLRPDTSPVKESPIFVLTITARGRPLGEGDKGIFDFLNFGHRAVVTAFEKMTAPELHVLWGKQ